MPNVTLIAADLVAVAVLIFGLYFPRHRRRDLLVAFLGLNVGILAVSEALSSFEIGAGLGLGLFGVLSIIRLRSTELDHQEVAYYFAALALGLLGGISTSPLWIAPVLMAVVVFAIYVGDHPALFRRQRAQLITLDTAYTDETALVARLEQLLGARVDRVAVRRVDLVNDATHVEVRYRTTAHPTGTAETTFAGRGAGDAR